VLCHLTQRYIFALRSEDELFLMRVSVCMCVIEREKCNAFSMYSSVLVGVEGVEGSYHFRNEII
jgi:hypothetical protein